MIKKALISRWLSLSENGRYLTHVVSITGLIYLFMFLGSSFQFSIKALNPLSRSLVDYEITDIVFSKFRDNTTVHFDDNIIIVNTGKPDRKSISDALRKVSSFEPTAIGVDVLFSEQKDTAIDATLKQTIEETKNLVMATTLGMYDADQGSFLGTDDCLPYFCEDAATGYINFVAKDGYTIRLFSPIENVKDEASYSFATELVKIADPGAFNKLLRRGNEIERINYKGHLDTYVHYDIDQLLDSKIDLTDIFKDKIVLFGYTGGDEWEQSTRDKFYTPLNEKIAAKSLPDMYGLLIHANTISMILDGNYLAEVPKWISRLIEFIIIFLSVALIRMDFIVIKETYWILIRVVQIVVFLFLFYLVAGIFYYFNARLSLTLGIIGVLMTWDIVDFYENLALPRITSYFKKDVEVFKKQQIAAT